jgi:hypothetical protein
MTCLALSSLEDNTEQTLQETCLVGSSKLLLALASTVIFGSRSRGTHDCIFLSHYSGVRKIWPCGRRRALISGKVQQNSLLTEPEGTASNEARQWTRSWASSILVIHFRNVREAQAELPVVHSPWGAGGYSSAHRTSVLEQRRDVNFALRPRDP